MSINKLSKKVKVNKSTIWIMLSKGINKITVLSITFNKYIDFN